MEYFALASFGDDFNVKWESNGLWRKLDWSAERYDNYISNSINGLYNIFYQAELTGMNFFNKLRRSQSKNSNDFLTNKTISIYYSLNFILSNSEVAIISQMLAGAQECLVNPSITYLFIQITWPPTGSPSGIGLHLLTIHDSRKR